MRVVVLIGFLLCLTACTDVVSSNYSSYNAAVEAKLFQRGWLPDILPHSSFEITTHNDVASNTSHGSFRIPAEDVPGFLLQLQKSADGVYVYTEEYTWRFAVDERGYVTYELE